MLSGPAHAEKADPRDSRNSGLLCDKDNHQLHSLTLSLIRMFLQPSPMLSHMQVMSTGSWGSSPRKSRLRRIEKHSMAMILMHLKDGLQRWRRICKSRTRLKQMISPRTTTRAEKWHRAEVFTTLAKLLQAVQLPKFQGFFLS